VSDVEDFYYCMKHLQVFKQYIEREKQIRQGYEDDVKLARQRQLKERPRETEDEDVPIDNGVKWQFQEDTKQRE
jgi:CRISPR/Cas system-associated exonuclease Cas4 (RecB family)